MIIIVIIIMCFLGVPKQIVEVLSRVRRALNWIIWTLK